MKLEVREDSKNYVCSVVKIGQVFDIEGADRIKRVVVFGSNVVVQNTVKEGDIMLYFVSGTELNEEYCHKNNLFEKAELNQDTTKRGFINSKRRVKAIKLRGVISEGMIMPLNSLSPFCDVSSFKIGDEFTTINGNDLCKKYVVKIKQTPEKGNSEKNKPKNKLKDVLVDNQFRFHYNTAHFIKNAHRFSDEDEVIITRKLHGSSLILSNVLVKKKLSFKERVFKFLGAKIPETEYGVIWSSGKPKSQLPKGVSSESNSWSNVNKGYYTDNIWVRAFSEIGHTLEKGISIFGEIVGRGIQGDKFTYNQEYGIYIYRITLTTETGVVNEFSWEQLKEYCNKYGLNYVQEYFVGKLKELNKGDLVESLKEKYLNKSYPDCEIDEGICIRFRKGDEIFKLKSPKFILMESDEQEREISQIES